METIILTLLTFSFITVISIDTFQKRQKLLAKSK